jgi:hypothetical protein
MLAAPHFVSFSTLWHKVPWFGLAHSRLEQAVVAGEQIGKGVRSFVRKWRAGQDKTANTYVLEISL